MNEENPSAPESVAQRVAALRDPERRRRIVDEHATATAHLDGLAATIFTGFDNRPTASASSLIATAKSYQLHTPASLQW